MIYIGFALRNPWGRHSTIITTKHFNITTNKTIEVGLYRNSCIFEFSFGITSLNQDHAGFSFDIGFLGFDFTFDFYDNRHFNQQIK